MAAIPSNDALYGATRISIPDCFDQLHTNDLWKTTANGCGVTRSQQCYRAEWLAVPVLAGVVFLLALAWLAWWALAWPLIGTALGCLWGRAVAIVNGRAGR